ncbi:pantetheine-phosphate adenylyltransferase [Actinomyces sp. W5033]|uniref:pantetheine-phosphate adenylyltransferase n=1 Tax=Actinomyces sp. W5033 TaxID=3446479 RepID=UPI003EE069AC
MSAAPLPTSPPPAAPGARRLAVYPGSFDPITLGHVDVVTRALTIFDRVVVAVAHNAAKSGRHLLGVEERVELARHSLAHLEGVEVELVPGLLADYCRSRGATAIVKGLRSGTDLDAEAPMALLNRELGGPETVFLTADPAHAHVSSSHVKDIASHAGDVTAHVPACVAQALSRALGQHRLPAAR